MRQLGELEAVIMDRLWTWGRPALVREVVDDLHRDRPLAYTTVMTVMENLHRKGWLRREGGGRAGGSQPTGRRAGRTAAPMDEGLGPSRGPGPGAASSSPALGGPARRSSPSLTFAPPGGRHRGRPRPPG